VGCGGGGGGMGFPHEKVGDAPQKI